MKVVVYSALYGHYDTIKPMVPDDGYVSVMYHDIRGVESLDGWTTHRYCPHTFTSPHGDPAIVTPMLNHKYWKTHPDEAAPDADISIWVDASIRLQPGFVQEALVALGDDDWAMVRHPWRDCVYTEADYSAGLPRYASLADSLHLQARHYRNIGHPPHWGLPATGVNVRRHTPAVLAMSDQWWDECLNWSHQDQVSLPVLMRLNQHQIRFNYNIGWLDGWELWPHLR